MRGAAAGTAAVGPRVGLAVAAGGAAGALLRFALGGWAAAWAGGGLPWGTFAANVLGSLALGWFSGVVARREASPALRGFLGAGLCGGFTTFSAFGFETLGLVQRGELAAAAGYVVGSVAVCVAGVWVGFRAARRGGGGR